MSGDVQRFDAEYGWERDVPVPFYSRSWRTLWRWRAECPQHRRHFHSDEEWSEHYLREH